MRVRELDVLRAVAILLVLGRHAPEPSPWVAQPLRAVGDLWREVGWAGVDLFFVLSGFLVSGLLFSERERHRDVWVGRFLVRRGFKIYPPFYLLLLVTWAVKGRILGSRVDPRLLRYEALYLQNYRGAYWPHTWSLAVEEHFYVGLALLVLALARGRRDPFRPLAILLPVACLAVLAWRVHVVTPPYEPMAYLYPTHLRIDSLLWGVLLSFVYHFHPAAWRAVRRRRTIVLPLALVLLLPPFLWPIESSIVLGTYGLTAIAIGFALVIALAVPDRTARRTSAPSRGGPLAAVLGVLAVLGADSYSIYLWHMPVLAWVMPWWQGRLGGSVRTTTGYVETFAIFVLTSVLLGLAMARLVERPSLALRDRLFPSRGNGLDLGRGDAVGSDR